jgi:hypothetical protein
MRKKTFDSEDYFNFLYDMAFDSDDYVGLARILHDIEYRWIDNMDENRKEDGIDIRKYYLADELGYMPDDIDTYDPYIFKDYVSVFEVFVGFANRLCRDVLDGYEVADLIYQFCKNLNIYYENWEIGTKEKSVRMSVKKWENGTDFNKNIWGIGKKAENLDLWSQAMVWINEFS